jgi:hypothetical protein
VGECNQENNLRPVRTTLNLTATATQTKRILLLAASCAILVHSGWAANRVFALRPITVDDGLSQSHVTAIAQDHQGFIWIGTAVGLNRYDGHEFKIYTHLDGREESLSGDSIYALHVDRRGDIWVGTNRGLDRYVPSTDSFQHFTELAGQRRIRARAIDTDAQGNVWVAIPARDSIESLLVRLTPSTREVRRFSLRMMAGGEIVFIHAVDETRVVVVVRDPSGRSRPLGFAVGVLNPGTGDANEITTHFQPSSEFSTDERALSFAPATPTSFWLGAPGGQIFHVDLVTGEMRPYWYDRELQGANPAELVSQVVAGRDGAVWVVPTWRRPVRQPSGNTIYSIASFETPPKKSSLKPAGNCDLTRSLVISSLVDRTGVLWAGLAGAGMCAADLESGMFSRIDEWSSDVALSNNFVRSVWKTPEGILWVGTRSGLDRIDRRRSSVQRFSHRPGVAGSLSDDEIMSVLVDRGGMLWVGTQHGGLNWSRGQTGVFEAFRHDSRNPGSISSDGVTALLEDRSGTLWAATSGGGLNQFNSAARTFSVFRHSPDDPNSISSD